MARNEANVVVDERRGLPRRLLYLVVGVARLCVSLSLYRRHHNIVERSEAVVDIFVKIVDCRVTPRASQSQGGFNRRIIKKMVIFHRVLERRTLFQPCKWSIFHLYTMIRGRSRYATSCIR